MTDQAKARLIRIVVLGTSGVTSVLRGIRYLPGYTTEGLDSLTYVEFWLPLPAWAIIWIVLGCTLIASMILPELVIPSMSIFVGIHIIWSGSLIASWLNLGIPETWITGTTNAIIAIFAAVLLFTFDRPPRYEYV